MKRTKRSQYRGTGMRVAGRPTRTEVMADTRQPTEKQLAFLAKLGYAGRVPETRMQASWLIDSMKLDRKAQLPTQEKRQSGSGSSKGQRVELDRSPRASARQIQILRQAGYTGPEDITSREAVRLHSMLRS